MWILSLEAKRKLCKFLTMTPWNFVLILPNEFRRGHALCASVRAYREFANETQYFHEILTPTILGGMSQCMGTLIFPILERNLLVNHSQPKNQEPSIDHLTVGAKLAFFCAFFYNLCIVEADVLPFGIDPAEWIVVSAYMALPLLLYINKLRKQRSSKNI